MIFDPTVTIFAGLGRLSWNMFCLQGEMFGPPFIAAWPDTSPSKSGANALN